MLTFAKRPSAGRLAFEKKAKRHVRKLERYARATDEDGAPRPSYSAINRYIKSHDVWGRDAVKPYFFGVQHHKCAYCEMKLSSYGDVEHFRPKNAIYKLKTRGGQRGANTSKERTYWMDGEKPGTWDTGYWWLAYDWDNYLVACEICNQQYKSSLFPVHGGHRRRPQKGDETRKKPYILDPYGSEDPAEHLRFTRVGGIMAKNRSRYGRESINVYGLDRANLVDSRSRLASRIHGKVRQLLENADTEDEMKPILKDIEGLGHEKEPHAGMVRTIFRHETGWTWQQLLDWLATH